MLGEQPPSHALACITYTEGSRSVAARFRISLPLAPSVGSCTFVPDSAVPESQVGRPGTSSGAPDPGHRVGVSPLSATAGQRAQNCELNVAQLGRGRRGWTGELELKAIAGEAGFGIDLTA